MNTPQAEPAEPQSHTDVQPHAEAPTPHVEHAHPENAHVETTEPEHTHLDHAAAESQTSEHPSDPNVLSELLAAASERRLCVALEKLAAQGISAENLGQALCQQDADGTTPWAAAVHAGEFASIGPTYLKALDLQHDVGGKTFLELCLSHGAETGDWAIKRLKTKTVSRAKLLSSWGQKNGRPLAHFLALHNHLRDFVSRLSKSDIKHSEAAAASTPGQDHAALLESLSTQTPALPDGHFGDRHMNLIGSAAAGGHFDQFGESFFSITATTETLLPSDFSAENQVHFIQVAHANGHLTRVPGAVWKRLQRLSHEELNDAQKALLAELLAFHAELIVLYCAKLEADPSFYHREIPPDFKSEPAILAIQRRNDLKRYEESPIPFEHLPQRFQQGEDALLSWSKPWIKHLASAIFSFDRIPERLRDNADALEAWSRPWIELLNSEAVEAYKIPPQLRNDPRVITARVNFYCKAVQTGEERALRAVPAELRDLPEMASALAEGWSVWFAQQGIKGWDQLPAEIRTIPKLQEQCAALWLARIAEFDVEWPSIPAEVRAQKHVVEAWLAAQPLLPQMEVSFAEIAAVPAITKVTLQLWRNSNHWNRQKAGTMLIELRNAPWQFPKLQPSAQAHPMIRAAAYEGISELVRQNWAYFQVAPEAFHEDEELLELAVPEWLESVKVGSVQWEQIPAELRAAESLQDWKEKQDAKSRKVEREEKQAKVQSRVRVQPHLPDAEMSAKELKDAGIRKVRSNYWARRIQSDPLQYLEVPESLLNTPAVEAAMRGHWGPIVHSNPDCFHDLPERIRADVGIQRVYKIKTRSTTEAEVPPAVESGSETEG